jgi:hypothetical protein
MMFVMLLWVCIHIGQAEKFVWPRWEWTLRVTSQTLRVTSQTYSPEYMTPTHTQKKQKKTLLLFKYRFIKKTYFTS